MALYKRTLETVDVDIKQLYVNSGFIKRVKHDKSMAESSLCGRSALFKESKRHQILLTRMSWYPELVFSRITPFSKPDPENFMRWQLVKECPYISRHKYTQVFYNQGRPDLNNFMILQNQEYLVKHLEK
jgi:hypothetical protein